MFDYNPTPYWNYYFESEFPYEYEVVINFINGGDTEIDHYSWKENITETGSLAFEKKLSEVRNKFTKEFLGYIISGYVWYDHEDETSLISFPIQKVFREKDAAVKFYSDLNIYWMRAELEIQKEKQR